MHADKGLEEVPIGEFPRLWIQAAHGEGLFEGCANLGFVDSAELG
jgi:hypothetical protein